MTKIKKILNISNCPICYSKSIRKTDNLNSYELMLCMSCDLLFTKQKVQEERIEINKSIYNGFYLKNYELRNQKLMDRFRKRILEIETYIKGGALLDYGCSTGVFLQSVKKYSHYSWKCTGIDINKSSIERAKKNNINAIFINGTVNKISVKKNTYDVITCFDVLEHDININETIPILYKIIKPGGILVVQSPNYKSIMAKFCKKNWDWWSVPDHVFHFSTIYLIKYLQARGFKVVFSKTWDPREDFVKNIQGTIRGKNSNIYRKIGAKFSFIILNIFWYISWPLKIYGNMGGLTLVIAQKV